MSLLYCDGWEQYAAVEDLQKTYPAAGAAMSLTTDTVFARGKALRLGTGTAVSLQQAIPQQALNAVVGQTIRFRCNTLPAASDRKILLAFFEGTNQHIRLYLQTDGTFGLYAGNAWRAYSLFSINVGIWYHLEIKCSCDDANGFFELRVNGNTVLTYAGDTRNGGTGLLNYAVAAMNTNTSASGECDFDDWVVWDAAGEEFNDWIGDCEVQTSMPTEDDVVTNWTPNTGDAWDAINDDGEDGDATYIASSTLASPASFEMADLATTPDKILGVQAFIVARKDDSGNRSIKFGIDSNGEVAESDDTPLGTAYTGFTKMFEKNPDGDVEWTPAAVNALKARVQVTV